MIYVMNTGHAVYILTTKLHGSINRGGGGLDKKKIILLVLKIYQLTNVFFGGGVQSLILLKTLDYLLHL